MSEIKLKGKDRCTYVFDNSKNILYLPLETRDRLKK